MESENKKSGLGILALILGIIGMLLSCIAIGIIPCVVGLIISIVVITKKNQKHGMAIAGLVCSVIGIGIFLLVSLLLGSASDESTVNGGSGNNTEFVDENTLAEQMSVEEYFYENTIGDTLYFLVVTNNSDRTVEINVNSIAKDSSGNAIGATDSYEVAVASGEKVCLCNYFDSVKDADSFEYTMTVKEDIYYQSVKDDLEIRESKTSEKVIITCTNNGEEPAQFIEVYALFFSNGQMIGYDSTYITDDDSELKPGATLSAEVKCYDAYDDVLVFVHGRR